MSDYDKLAELLNDNAGRNVTIDSTGVTMKVGFGEVFFVYRHNGTGKGIQGAIARLHAGEPPDARYKED